MRLQLKTGLLAIALCAVASPALAHGISIELVAVILGTWGAVAGLIGGIASAALRFRVLVGLVATIGTFLIAGVLYALADSGDPSSLGNFIREMLTLLSVFGVLPLVIVFFIAFAAVSLVRARIESKWKKR